MYFLLLNGCINTLGQLVDTSLCLNQFLLFSSQCIIFLFQKQIALLGVDYLVQQLRVDSHIQLFADILHLIPSFLPLSHYPDELSDRIFHFDMHPLYLFATFVNPPIIDSLIDDVFYYSHFVLEIHSQTFTLDFGFFNLRQELLVSSLCILVSDFPFLNKLPVVLVHIFQSLRFLGNLFC